MNQQNTPNGYRPQNQGQPTGYRPPVQGQTNAYGHVQQTPVPYQPQQQKKSSGGKIAVAVVGGLLALLLLGVGGIVLFGSKGTVDDNSATAVKSQDSAVDFNEVESPQTDTTINGSGDILTPAQVAAKVRPSIVSVVTVDNVNYMSSNSGEGSGIILSSDGYIVTNSHVIGDSSKYDVSVITSDGQTYEAKVIGYDTRSDLAVLKINASGLPECELGDSSQLVLGD